MQTQPLNFVRPVPRFAADRAADAPSRTWSRMEVVLKVTERCNIDCTYCYFFNLRNDDYKAHPPYIGVTTVEQVGRFLADAARAGQVQELQIDFHGGEPLMMKKERFDAMCRTFYALLAEVPQVRLVMQTNAMLIDDEWIELFARHRIGIGISIDGPRAYHDKYRVDHKGNGTYDATIAGLRKLQAAIWDGRLRATGVGLICVIDPEQDARATFNHFVDDLGLQHLHFLLPMYDHDTVPPGINEKMSKYLCDLFDAWVERGDPAISIRYLRQFFSLLMGGGAFFETFDDARDTSIAFTVASNGDIGPADDLRNSFPELFRTGANAASATLAGFLDHGPLAAHREASAARHPTCRSCCWGKVCDGGDLIGTEAFRYARASGFANPSVYCASIQALLTHMARFAVAKGVPFTHLAKVLVTDEPTEAALTA